MKTQEEIQSEKTARDTVLKCRDTYLDVFGREGYTSTTFVDYVVCSVHLPQSCGGVEQLASWYENRAACLREFLARGGG